MDEQPQPPAERHETIEHRETIERRTGTSAAPAHHAAPPRRSMAWLWVVLLLLVVGALAWFALSRGEPADLEMPTVEAPDIEVPDPEPNIEVNVQPSAEAQ